MLCIISCKASDRKEKYQNISSDSVIVLKSTYQRRKIDDRTNNVLKEFIADANCKECIHEMYIDKIKPDQIIIVLKSRVYSTEYLNKTNPLFTSIINGVQFNIFCGLEDIFWGDKTNLIYPSSDSAKAVFKVWSLFIKPDSIKVEKDAGYPFFPAETPKIEIRK